MKRYWRLIIITAVVVLTIGTFYIQSSLAASNLPGITIKTISGHADEIDPVTIKGEYQMKNQFIRVKVDKTGAAYRSHQSLFERSDNFADQEEVKRLQEEYRNFMRGKSGMTDSYLETENYLAYAETKRQYSPQEDEGKLNIAVLDKEKDDTSSFTMSVPNKNRYDFLFVKDVQMSKGELVIITNNTKNNGKGEEVHLYRINVEEQTMISDKTISSKAHSEQDKESMNYRVIPTDEKTDSRKDILFQITQQIPISDSKQREPQDQQYKTETLGYISYNLNTEKITNLDIPEDLADQEPIIYDDTTLYLKHNEDITTYNFEEGRVTHKVEFPHSESIAAAKKDKKLSPLIRVRNDKAYILTQSKEVPQRLFVLDLTSGETLYEGRLIFDDFKDNETFDMHLLTIE